MSLTHEQRERLPETLAKATDGPWAVASNRYIKPACKKASAVARIVEFVGEYKAEEKANADLVALAPAMAETIIEDDKTIADRDATIERLTKAYTKADARARDHAKTIAAMREALHTARGCAVAGMESETRFSARLAAHNTIQAIDAILNDGAQS